MLSAFPRQVYRAATTLVLVASLLAVWAVKAIDNSPHLAMMSIDGPIGPATTDYVNRSLQQAHDKGATLAIINIDTPGGLDAATRDIIQTILDAPIPVVSYVHPAGARAASAGTYILYASHVAAMTPSTTLGAATPVSIGGGDLPGFGKPADNGKPAEDKSTEDNSQAMQRKVINDAVAFIRGLAQRHQRNADWAEQAVRHAATLTAEEARQQQVIDLLAINHQDLQAQLHGLTVSVKNHSVVIASKGLPLREYLPDWRNQLLAIITNPQVAYILLLIGIYGLIFEGYSPGALVPGVVGIICLLLSLYALQVLPVNYAGLALIVAGALLIAAEAFMPSFGVLGIGGIVALVFGSIMLIDSSAPGMEVSRALIAAIGSCSGLVMLAILLVVKKNLRMIRPASNQALVGQEAIVTAIDAESIQVLVHGEHWFAYSEQPLHIGQQVSIYQQQGLKLAVKPLETTGE